MKQKIILMVFIFIITNTAFLSIGCGGWVALLDTNPYDDRPADHKEYHENEIEKKRLKLLGSSKDEVLIELGTPSRVNKIGDNYQIPMKFREKQVVFDGSKRCLMVECGPIFSDESWSYHWERRTKQYYSQHGFGVFFKDNVVVSVE